MNRLLEIRTIKGKIECKTGLMIGGTGGVIQIGGIDNPIIRNPLNREPYIPGSSLKGKMRSLLEINLGKVDTQGGPHKGIEACNDEPCPICQLFGTAADGKSTLGPGRLIFRDCQLNMDSRDELLKVNKRDGTEFTEVKTEVSINRWSAKSSGLRQMERVPAGAQFELTLNWRIFENDDTDKLLQQIKNGLALIEQDALGGSGSRGYGRVKFNELTLDGEHLEITQ